MNQSVLDFSYFFAAAATRNATFISSERTVLAARVLQVESDQIIKKQKENLESYTLKDRLD